MLVVPLLPRVFYRMISTTRRYSITKQKKEKKKCSCSISKVTAEEEKKQSNRVISFERLHMLLDDNVVADEGVRIRITYNTSRADGLIDFLRRIQRSRRG